MDFSSLQSFLKGALHLGLLKAEEIQQILRTSQTGGLEGWESLLLRENLLTAGQIRRVQALVQRGYFFCSSCRGVFPFQSTMNRSRSYGCPRCKRALEFCGTSLATPFPQDQTPPTVPQGFVMPPSRKVPNRLEFLPPPPFQALKVLGRGGGGKVYSVQDPLSNRTVALKILLPQRAGDLKVKKRFFREIQITSILEHPNIIPVYESGYLKDGSLYFAMKEVRGGTLSDLLEPVGTAKKRRKPLRDLLKIFLKVCDALSYAHSRGVIHRDLKPSNIAVGDFGEVLVMDWGVARCKGVDEVEGDSALKEEIPSSQEGLTVAGSIMGTPGYLSPEQAEGKDVDDRSDVYSLGAILYEILALEPVWQGRREERLIAPLLRDPLPPQERRGDLDIPRELSSIALKALSRKTKNRYQTVGDLKADLVRFLEGYGVSVRKYSLWERGWMWARRNRSLTIGLVMVVLGLFMGTLGVYWWNHRIEKGKLKGIEERLSALRDQIESQSQSQRKEKLKGFIQMKSLIERAREVDSQKDLWKKRLWSVQKKIGLLALEEGNYLLSQLSFEQCLRLGEKKEGQRLLDFLDAEKNKIQRLQQKRIQEIMKLLSQGNPGSGAIDEYVTEMARMKGSSVTLELLPYLEKSRGRQRRAAIEALGKLGDRDTKWKGKDTVEKLILLLKKVILQKDLDESVRIIWALGRLRDSRANFLVYLIRNWMGENSLFAEKTRLPYSWIPLEEQRGGPRKASQWLRQGIMKIQKRDYQGALWDLSQAIHLSPREVAGYANRGVARYNLGDFPGALEDYTRAISLDPKRAAVYTNRGIVYGDAGQCEEALRDHNKSISLNPKDPMAYNNRASVYLKLKKYSEALSDLNKALSLNPKIFRAYSNRGAVRFHLGDLKGAIADYSQALKLSPRQGEMYINRAVARERQRDYQGAREDYDRAIRLNPQISAAYNNRGGLRKKEGDYRGALLDFSQALSLDPKNAKAFSNRGDLYYRQKLWDQAISDYTRVIVLTPREGAAYRDRANSYYQKGLLKEALADFSQALFLNSEDLDSLNNRGMTRMDLKDFPGALEDFTRAIVLRPEAVEAYVNRGNLLAGLGKFKGAVRDYSRAISLKPALALPYKNRGLIYHHMKQYKKAATDFQKYLQRNPQDPRADWYRNYIQKMGE